MILMKKRILVAEDDPSIRKAMKLRLEYEGFTVLVYQDGEELLREAEKDPSWDLILLDVKMPRMNGYEACQRLRTIGGLAGVPILIMSGTESEVVHLADRCIEAGADDWIRKPFQTWELMSKIHRLMEKNKEAGDGG